MSLCYIYKALQPLLHCLACVTGFYMTLSLLDYQHYGPRFYVAFYKRSSCRVYYRCPVSVEQIDEMTIRARNLLWFFGKQEQGGKAVS